jgi:hypothetical protein
MGYFYYLTYFSLNATLEIKMIKLLNKNSKIESPLQNLSPEVVKGFAEQLDLYSQSLG